MKKITVAAILVYAVFALLTACTTTGGGTDGLSLQEAIEQSAEKTAGELPVGSRVAIVAFESANSSLSDYIMEEITGALFDRGIEVADRRNLEYVYQELNFQMSGDVSDETAKSVGKFLAADMVITGQLIDLNKTLRYRTSAIHVEQATRASVTRLDVRGDKATRNMMAALAKQKTVVTATKYGVSEDKTPQTAGTFIDRGIMFAMRGEYDKAIADFDEAIRLKPDMAAAYILRARALGASVSRVIDVEENFSGITSFEVTGERLSVEQIQIYDRAIEDCTQAIRLEPDNVDGYLNRGGMYSAKGDFDRAIADFTRAIQLDPDNASGYGSRGNVYDKKGDFDRAIADFNRRIQLEPDDKYGYLGRGSAYANKGDLDRAIADYTQAIRLDPDDVFGYLRRSFTYSMKGNYNRAIADINQAIRRNPDSATAFMMYSNRGSSYVSMGKYKQAIADLNKAISLNPNHAGAYVNRGSAYAGNGDYDRAIADYNQAINLRPDFAVVYALRGVAYYKKRDYNHAIADFEATLRIDPDNADAKRWLEGVRQIRG